MKVKARINHGRWICDCPNCGGAEVVQMGKPFECKSQQSAGFHGEMAACGFTAEVEFPADKIEIEKLLIQRPIANRNWAAGETVADLQKENAAKGL